MSSSCSGTRTPWPSRRALFPAVAGLCALIASCTSHGSASAPSTPTTQPPPIPAIEAGILPWSLPATLSRASVLPLSGTVVDVIGGITGASQVSIPKVSALDTANGKETLQGDLPAGVHDDAAAQLGGIDFIFGGGTPDTVAGVNRVTTSPSFSATTSGTLPQPRSDAVAVTIGNSAYVVGGYDGTNPDSEVLSTSDGSRFSNVAALPVPVRYAAVAPLGNLIYVFGGELTGGPSSGQLTNLIQEIDVSHRTAKVLGHMGATLAGASAFVIGGHIYVAGGISAPTPASTPAAPASSSKASSPVAESQASSAPSSAATDFTGVEAYDPTTGRLLPAGNLPQAVAYAGSVVVGNRGYLIGGEVNGSPVASVEMITPNTAFGTAGASGAGSPYFGAELLIADRGNNRLLLLDDTGKIIWSYPSAYAAPPPGGFYFPDDAFFARHGSEIISNQEENETIVIIGFPSGKVLWQYGHPKQSGSSQGFLYEPDDAYLLKNGQVTVADADNCRVLFINPDGTVANQVGTTRNCVYKPPTSMTSPNGDTPLADGNVLVSEISGVHVDEYTPQGTMLWSVHLPIAYPSDPQQLGPDLYLISDYSHPGAILEFNREGQITYDYRPSSGPGELNQPSLTELIPSGVFMSNDDYRHRVVAIDPATQALVWQYGTTDTPGTGPNQLDIPDGFDILMPDGSTPTHPYTG